MKFNTDGVIFLAKVIAALFAFAYLVRFLLWVNRKRDEKKTAATRAVAAKSIPTTKDLDAFEDRYGHFAVRAVGLEAIATDEDKERTGGTRIGGRPDLPSSFAWPLSTLGTPMSFLAQFELRKVAGILPDTGAPSSGSLYFFARCDEDQLSEGDRGVECAVLFAEEKASPVRRDFPMELTEESRFKPCAVGMRSVRTWPDSGVLSASGRVDENDEIHRQGQNITLLNTGSHLFGAAMPIYEAIEFDTHRRYLKSIGIEPPEELVIEQVEAEERDAAREWTLLLQLDSEPAAGMDFHEEDRLYFMIRRSDLAAMDFSRVVCLMQCCGPDHWTKLPEARIARSR